MAEQTTIDALTILVERPRVESRPPILMLHGYFGQASVFQPLMTHFSARGHSCFALNFRGRCASRPGTELGRVSIRDFADDAASVARTLEKPIVIGHSMGGLVAQMIAAQDLVRSAVLLAPAPPRGITIMSLRLAIAQLGYLPAILTSRVVVPSARHLKRLVMNRVAEGDKQAAIEQLVPDSGRAGRELSIVGVPVDAGQIRVPVLIVAGDADRLVPLTAIRRIAARYSASLHVAKGRGHMLITEPGWEDIASYIDGWLERAGS